jgi:hypothetical protein
MNEELSQGIKLVRGNPTAEELAAAIAVVEAMLAEEQAAASAGRQQPKSTWNRNSVNLRGGITPGFGQWKASFRDGLN